MEFAVGQKDAAVAAEEDEEAVAALLGPGGVHRPAYQLQLRCVARMANLLEGILDAYPASAEGYVAAVASAAVSHNTEEVVGCSAEPRYGLG